jgi:hypothetical protein
MPVKRYLLISAFMILTILLASCSQKHYSETIPKEFQMIALGKEKKIPLRAGLSLKPEYQKLIAPKFYYENQTVHMGEAFYAGCERMLKNIFQDVIVIDAERKQEVDIVVSPEIAWWQKEQKLSSDNTFPIYLNIKWNISTPDGKLVYLNTIKSLTRPKISRTASWGETRREDLKEAYVMSLNDQLLQAQEDIYSSKWWADLR